jgi:hypothetical protein
LNKKTLKKRIIATLHSSGYSTNGRAFNGSNSLNKDDIRALHKRQRAAKLLRENRFLKENLEQLKIYFADGSDVNPELIDPQLIEVRPDSIESRIFRLASLYWSVPVSQGFGRRLRFLVMDKQNNKLIGIIALGDPVYNLRVREEWVGWTTQIKSKKLINVLDAYVLGAIPPYSNLIGGKLVGALLLSDEIQKIFNKKYGHKRTIISNRDAKARLVLITTSSALGKSSIYDRLKLNGDLLYLCIGETQGYGHFHINGELFELMRAYLKSIKHPYASGNRFGNGPNWKFRVIRVCLTELGLNPDYLSHGIRREVYVIPLAKNTREYLRGDVKRLFFKTKSTKEISELCKNRWIIPRANRDSTYRQVRQKDTIKKIIEL